MFGGKKEKVLEEELRVAKEQNEKQQELIKQIAEQQDEAAEQFARGMAARAQIEKNVELMQECLTNTTENSESNQSAAEEIHSQIVAINNAVETFSVNHAVFMRQQKEQDDKIMEIVENNKHFTTPMKCISEFPVFIKEEKQQILNRTNRMTELSKNMGVLSLNAAIEAGRIGENGTKFMEAAEEIRTFSEQYEKEAVEMAQELTKSEDKIKELEEQISHLNQLLKDNNISMGKLLKDSMMSMATYEAGQLELKEIVSDELVGKADTLCQREKENGELQKTMTEELEGLCEELEEQKGSSDELETIFKKLQQKADSE